MREQFAGKPNEPETLGSYHETCHKFRMENIQYYTENNFFRGNVRPLEGNLEDASEESRQNLAQVEEFYTQEGDKYNLLRLNKKLGNKRKSHELAQQIWGSGDPVLKAHTAREMWQLNRTDEMWKDRAMDALSALIRKYESEGKYLMVAVNYDLLSKITRNERDKDRAIEAHRAFAAERGGKGDSWWRAISLREIAKISGKEGDIKTAFAAANFEIDRAEKVGDFKNAGLWARDLARLEGTPKNKKRAEELFLKQIETSEHESDTRTTAKSYWEMWKATNKDEYKKKALGLYEKLLGEAKKNNNREQIEECYRVILYLS